MRKPAAFLDRDGVINKDKGYVYKIKDFQWIEGAVDAIKFLNESNYYVFIVSNQSGISRGYYESEDVDILHNYISSELKKVQSYIDEFFYSPYHPEGLFKEYESLAHLRKPETGMLEMAEKKWKIIKRQSFMIGNMPTDIECAKKFGIDGYLFKDGNLYDFVSKIVST